MIYPAGGVRFFATGLDHPEGVAVGPDGAVYAGGEAGQVYRITGAGCVEVVANTGGSCLGIAPDRRGNLYICDGVNRAVMLVAPGGRCERFCDRAGETRFLQPNFPVFDSSGTMYVSDSGDWGKANAVLYRVDSGGTARVFHPGPFHFANGLALDAAEEFLYVVESTLHRVLRIPLLDDGAAGTPEVFAEGLARVPDGLAFDRQGNLYVTCFANDTLWRVGPAGEKALLCRDEDAFVLNRPTNCAFAGSRLLVANLGGDCLSALDLHTAGMPLYHEALP